ncbi:arsenical pump membrane protein [Endobacter medicaginis]|uniref:Arsenical pump membrane protein n=3 Tax=Endobacter medicaginis TaxID=1181271 RepID=A0A839V2V2_9PROT|nr:arsenic transporter [Endobacter medicaginis]MBB3173902.1 arsenical pump membrane protein [Endobacter medicaginis]MCX5475977.1 arsenic transporter [Endobacter medicaginis]
MSVLLIWAICAVATACVILRPLGWPEWIWAVVGATLLVATGRVPVGAAIGAIGRGGDVYLFLAGMMLLSEAARAQGLFDWVAACAARLAGGSRPRLFTLVFGTGAIVTVLMSNDATAVVLTPAVFAAARHAEADALPLLLACALIANAASFVLPISNPANLVMYGGHMPPLGAWLDSFTLPSLAAIGATYAVLRLLYRRRIGGRCTVPEETPRLSRGGVMALVGIGLTALLLVVISALDRPLGAPTALAGTLTALGVCALTRNSPLRLVRSVSWGLLPLVAGLFVLVEALKLTGVTGHMADLLRTPMADPRQQAALAGSVLALACNLVNNLPAGLVASSAIAQAQPPDTIVDALLIGVDLGPNLSVTGSLATILWLQAIRREGEAVGFWTFLRCGAVAMPTALAAALAARLIP